MTRVTGCWRHAARHGATCALVTIAALGRPAAAQSLLDRPPNLSGNWVGNSGTVYFNFVHRFNASDAPERKVSNFPTFLVATGLPYRLLAGFNYATNSDLTPRYPNEWEFFARHHLLRQDDGAPLDIGGQVAYNLSAEGVDGEVSVARRIGPVRVLGAGRVLSSAVDNGDTRFAVAGGATVRLGRFFALAGDVARVTNDEPGDRAAWSAGVHIALPYTPHTLSLQATNTNVGTLQGVSRGGDITRYGFEFTVPITLRRWFGRPTMASDVASPPGRTDTVVVQRDTVAVPPAPAARADAPRTDTLRAPALRPDTTAVASPAAGRPRPPGAAPARPATRPAVVNVVMRNTTFVPGRIQIAAGTTVVWKNDDQLVHTVTANDKSFDSGLMEPGKTYRRTFDRPGTYPYYCMPHPFMKGVVVVR